jgi:hypothetical protein
MDVFRPRLTNYYGIPKNQANLDFAIELMEEFDEVIFTLEYRNYSLKNANNATKYSSIHELKFI